MGREDETALVPCGVGRSKFNVTDRMLLNT